jgi:hypothetical protein
VNCRELGMFRVFLKVMTLAILTLVGCQGIVENNQSSISIKEFTSLKSVKDYLSTKLASRGFNGKSYCAYEVLDAEAEGKSEKIYLWVLCQEYYRANQKLQQGTGSSFPLALTVRRKNNELYVISHQKPRDGALYSEDILGIFPEKVRAKIQSETTDSYNRRVQKLQNEVKQEAEVS